MLAPPPVRTAPQANWRRRSLALLATCSTVLLMTSCFGSTPKTEYYYYLTAPKTVEAPKKGATLAVDDFAVAPGYGKQRMAFRTQANELSYYGYRAWVSAPSKMLQTMAIRHLRASALFAQVEPESKLREPVALLQGTVEALEELDQGNKTWAHLAMRFVVRDASSQRVLLRYDFDKRFPCIKRHPREVAHGISKILELEMRKLATRIGDAVK